MAKMGSVERLAKLDIDIRIQIEYYEKTGYDLAKIPFYYYDIPSIIVFGANALRLSGQYQVKLTLSHAALRRRLQRVLGPEL